MQNETKKSPSYEELLRENQLLKEQLEALQAQLNNFKRMLFGQKRERFVPTANGQLALFEGSEEDKDPPVAKEEITYSRNKTAAKKQTPHFRNPIPAHIPRKEIIIEPEGIDTNSLKRIGEEVTEELEYEEAKLYVNKYIRPKYVKPADEGEISESERIEIIIAELPGRIIPKGIPGVGLLSHIIVSKFIDHLPIYRIRRQLKRSGINLAESTINDWIKAVVELLEPLYHIQRARILGKDYLMVDETTIRVLDKNKKGKSHTGYHWVYYDPLGEEVFFEYQKGRNSEFPTETLKDFKGHLQTDGYAGYNEVGRRKDVIQLACFAHARRKFENALSNDKKRASWILKHIRYLYLVERRARDGGLSYEERYKLRQRHSMRQLKNIRSWLIKNKAEVLPKSSIGKAIDYTLNLWSRLARYVEDGRFEIDNNLVENSIRPIAIGRKNYLFAGSHNGAQWAAILYTLLAAAELKGLEPKSWLKELLKKIPDYQMNKLEELLPVPSDLKNSPPEVNSVA